ncbi:MAG TPA: TIGR02996 domain-containing protein [Gemmataceae bacterium]|nr:TIGR02996 domain-containing protein [Gemmataceae bacterium]
MTHPPRFLQTILATPRDDSPRLRYAKWLEGCGNPLGEFIRLQCDLARDRFAHPPAYCERRAQQLLAEHQGFWADAVSHRVSWCSFRRGFVEEIAITDRQLIRHAADLFQRAPVLDIHLVSDGRRLDELPELPDLPYTFFLDLSAQGLGDDGVARLADSPFLLHAHGLNLGSTYLGDDGLDALAHSPFLTSLRELYLNDNPITDDGIRQFVLAPIAERLDVLDVRTTQIGEDGVEALRHLLGEQVLC